MGEFPTPEDATAYLHDHIPLSKAMGVVVRSISVDKVELIAPLAPNINHRQTVFGGSIASIATLAAWVYIHFRLQVEVAFSYRVVITKSETDFLHPVAGDFIAVCPAPDSADWSRFKKALSSHNKGRVTLSTRIVSENATDMRLADFVGTFVALKRDDNAVELS